MAIPDDWDLRADIVGYLLLVELDTTDAMLRFILNDEGWFVDKAGNEWMGSKLIEVSEIDFSINGDAPNFEIGFSYTVDPDADDLVAEVRKYGVQAVRHRPATFYLQPIGALEEMYAPVKDMFVFTRRTMMNLKYSFPSPTARTISVVLEGPMNLRSNPINGRYTTSDATRRNGFNDPSFEFMPNNAHEEQSLFGL